jgi:hypothetical protein
MFPTPTSITNVGQTHHLQQRSSIHQYNNINMAAPAPTPATGGTAATEMASAKKKINVDVDSIIERLLAVNGFNNTFTLQLHICTILLHLLLLYYSTIHKCIYRSTIQSY